MKYVSITNHMWSGFNMLAHLPIWKRMPNDIQAVIERNLRVLRSIPGHLLETAVLRRRFKQCLSCPHVLLVLEPTLKKNWRRSYFRANHISFYVDVLD